MNTKHDPQRRDLLKKAVYVAPAIVTLQAYSAVAKAGSDKGFEEDPKKDKKWKKRKKKYG